MAGKEYWESSIPWAFQKEGLSYAERRRLRYDLQDYMLEAIPFGKYSGRKVLEIGCGAGIDSAEFARKGAIITGVDFTNNSVSLTKKTLDEAGVSGSVQLMDAKKLDFPDDTFDLAYSYGVLHHIPQVDAVLNEITRVLKPRGDGVFMVYNKDSLLNAYSIIFLHRGEGLPEEELATKYSERNLGNPYTKLYSKAEAEELFAKYFGQVRVSTHYKVIDTDKQRKVKFGGPDELGWHHVIYCSKPFKT